VDTPGIHRPLHKLGRAMVESATRALGDADVSCFCAMCLSCPPRGSPHRSVDSPRAWRAAGDPGAQQNDRLPPDKVLKHTEAYWALLSGERKLEWDWMMLSATTGDNRDKLLDMIIARLPEGPMYYPKIK